MSLFDYIKQIQSQASTDNFIISTNREVPEVVKEILIVRQLESRANEVFTVSHKLLDDLQGSEDLNIIVTEMIKDMKQQHNELFESWCTEIIGYIKDQSLR